jgi:type I restriction enzyme S subunit
MTIWHKRTIGELCDAGGGEVKTGPFGSQLHQSDYQIEGTPVVMPADIVGEKFDITRIARVSDSHVDRLYKHKLSKGDIVYGRRGDIGRQALVREENVGWLCGTGCLRITLAKSAVLPEFLHLYLSLPEIVGWIENQAVGATMPNLNTGILRRVPVCFPEDKNVQQKIVSTVFAYDDFIENNKRRTILLQKMAEEIYREWFVRLRFPGYEKVKVVKGVPEGWQVLSISKLCAEIREGIKKKNLSAETRYLGLEHIPRKSILVVNSETADSVQSDKLRFRKRDILFGKIRPYLHKVAIASFDGACSTDIIVLRPKQIKYEAFLLFTVFNESFIELATIASKGTKMPRADWDFLKKLDLIVPSDAMLEIFQMKFEPIFQELSTVATANILLTETRERFLNRLISGKLSVENLAIQFPPSMKDEAVN